MDSYQPPHHSYMRPPPPPPSIGSDPQFSQHHHHYQQQYLPPPPPPPPQQYSAQFQYHHPPPPPPQQNQWGPPPQPPPPPPSYAVHSHAPYPAPVPYPNQEWGNGNWRHHLGWEYPSANSNEEDWAAKAKAWASTRSSMENHLPQPATQQEDPSPYANQYPQPVESHYQDVQQTFVPASGFSSHQGPAIHHQEPASVSSYISKSRFVFSAKDEVSGGDMSAGFAQRPDQTNSSIYPQEVPSCYSSIPGHEDSVHGKQHENSSLPSDGRLMPVDHPQFPYENQPLDQMNQPLEFASRFSHEIDHKMISSYPDSSAPVSGTDSVAAVSSFHSWSVPAASGASYPPNAPAFPSSNQHYSVDVHSLPGQHSPLFGTGPGFQPPVPNHVGMSDGMGLHPAVAFPVDAYGIPMSAERPKKAAVPNWLREEIIKTKATIARSAPDQFKEGGQSVEDELVDKPIETGDQEDSKSMDSARSAEEDDDEDEEDVQRTAAINQEIKRVLTEVLLKVTDDLFDEIATKVLSEDDYVPNGDSHVADLDNQIQAPKVSTPPVLATKESAKVIPAKVKESAEHASEETSLGAPANILGLSNYASDEDDEDQSSSIPKVDSNGAPGASENAEEHKLKPTGIHADYGLPASKLSDHRFTQDLVSTNDFPPNSGTESTVSEGEKGDGVISDSAKSADNGHKVTVNGADVLDPRKLPRDSSQETEIKRHERHESKSTSSGRDNYKETVRNREREAEKDGISSKRDERHKKKDKTEDTKSERVRDKKPRSPRHVEKARESDSSKKSPRREGRDKSDNKYERGRDKNRSSKDDGDRKRERTKDEKNDKSRHKSTDRHKRRRSSSVGSWQWQKPTKRSPIISDGSSDGLSEDFRRKSRSKRRNLSPSPARSRRRRVSRSPHSKHTQQRQHSPYSSLDDSRGKRSRSRSRSRSPVRRHRR